MNESAAPKVKTLTSILFIGLVLVGLYLTSLYSYLLFHSLTEIFSIVIGWSIFVLAWNSQQRLENHHLLFLGVAFFFISLLDMLHTLAYKGMGIFPTHDANLATQLWIAARYLQSLAFLISPLFLRHKMRLPWALAGFAATTTLLLTAIFTGLFPACFIEGIGLTPFKVISEYLISLILIAAGGLLFYYRAAFDRQVWRWLVASLLFSIASELTFTFYVSVYDFLNLLGHFFKIAAFYFLYKAIIEMGLERPQQLLFQNLQKNQQELREALGEVQRLAMLDSLTGLYNRRHFFEAGAVEIERAQRYHHPLSAIMLDLDYFKQVNDQYGHNVGDMVLRKVAECCRQETRTVDLLGRYGGEEFAILLPETHIEEASEVAERLRQLIAQMELKTDNGPLTLTASLGVAALYDRCARMEILLSHADQALYDAKHSGRNCVKQFSHEH